MNYLKQALTEYLSGLTTKKNEKEIWTKDKNGDSLTVEPIDDENYIVRYYFWNGDLWQEIQYKNNLRHGEFKNFNGDELLMWKEIWEDGVRK